MQFNERIQCFWELFGVKVFRMNSTVSHRKFFMVKMQHLTRSRWRLKRLRVEHTTRVKLY